MWNGTSGVVVGDVGSYDGGYDPVRWLRRMTGWTVAL